MKNRLTLFSLFLFVTLKPLYTQTVHTINVQNFSFSPPALEITAGDTLVWTWVSGSHTTTSDSSTGPNSWDVVISSSNPVYRHVITAPGLHRYYCKPHGGPGGSGMAGSISAVQGVGISEPVVRKTIALNQNYPNPFNPSTTISYQLAAGNLTSVKIYNLLGQEVKTLYNGYQNAGQYSIQWNGDNDRAEQVPSGIYIYRLISGNSFISKRCVYLK